MQTKPSFFSIRKKNMQSDLHFVYDKNDMEKLHFFFKSHLSYLYSALGKKDLPNNLVHNKNF